MGARPRCRGITLWSCALRLYSSRLRESTRLSPLRPIPLEDDFLASLATRMNYPWIALLLVFMGQLSAALANSVVAPLAPLFQPELGITKTQVGFFASAGYAGTWGVLLVAGSLADRYGVRAMVSIGQFLFGAFLLCMALTSDFTQALVVMLAVGVGRGIAVPSLSKGVADWFPIEQRGTAMGIKQTGVPVGGVITALTLPALGLAFGWRLAVAGVGIWILAAAIVTAVFYRDIPQPRGRSVPRPSARAGLSAVVRVRKIWFLSVVAICFLIAQTAMNAYLALFLGGVVLVDAFPDTASRVVAAGGFLAISQVGWNCGAYRVGSG